MPEEERKPRPPRTEKDTYSAFERRMIRASQEKMPVVFKMATDDIIKGFVLSVGDDFIEVDDSANFPSELPVWVGRPLILTARVMKR